MPKRGGKKKNNKNKGSGGGGAAAKAAVPDVKNVESTAQKEEERLEGESAEKTADSSATAPAALAASTETPVAGDAGEGDSKNDAQSSEPSVSEDKKEEVVEPAREKEDTPATAASEPAESVATTSPTDAMSAPAEKSSSEKETEDKTEATEDTKATSEESKPVSTPSETVVKDDTASKADAAAEVPTAQDTQKTDATPSTVPESNAEKSPSGEKDASLAAPHVKRPHQTPVFVTQESEQPPKKPRVDDHEVAAKMIGDSFATGKDASTSELDVPGRFPGTPSVADSAASVTGSAAGGPTSDATDSAKAKSSVANDTLASNTNSTDVADTVKANSSAANEIVTSETDDVVGDVADSAKAKESAATDALTSKTDNVSENVTDNVKASQSVANDNVTSEKTADTTSAQKDDDNKGPATTASTSDNQPAPAASDAAPDAAPDKLTTEQIAGAGNGVATAGLGTQVLNKSNNGDISSTKAATSDSPLVATGVDTSSKVVDAGASAAKDSDANQTSATNGQSSSQAAQDSTQAAQPEESKPDKPEEAAPAKNDDVNGKADSAPANTSEPEQKPQETPDRSQSTAAIAQTKSKSSGKSSEKKGGFFAWLKRKFRGEKSEKSVNGTTSN